MKTDKYTDKNGVEKYSTKIVAKDMVMLGGKAEGNESASNAGSEHPKPAAPEGHNDFDDEIPFFLYEYKSIV